MDISIGARYDYLSVDFIAYQELWYSNDIYSYLNEKSFHMERMIQKQMPNTEASRAILGLAMDSKIVLMISLAVAFTLNHVLSG